MNALEEHIVSIMGWVIPLVEACGALIVILGVIRTFVHHVRRFFPLDATGVASTRFQLVQSLVMGLEFQVAADVLKTAVSPSWDHILMLAAIIALRAVLGYSLGREAQALHALCATPEHAGTTTSESAM